MLPFKVAVTNLVFPYASDELSLFIKNSSVVKSKLFSKTKGEVYGLSEINSKDNIDQSLILLEKVI